jgi:hypothetical protein
MKQFYAISFFLTFIILVLPQFAASQASGYTFSQSQLPGDYIELTGGTVFQNGTGVATNAATTVATPFPISYNCRNYNSITILNNGFITLGLLPGASTPSITNTVPLSTTTGQQLEGIISPFGSNLVASTISGATPSITYGLQSGKFIVQWKDVAINASLDRFNIQAEFQPNGVIKFKYGACTTNNTTSANVCVGLRGEHLTDFTNREMNLASNNNTWLQTTAGAGNGVTSKVQLNGTTPVIPPQDLVFTWTPNCPTIQFQPFPANLNFESSWIGNFNSRPNVYSATWPGRGNPNWFQDNESASNTAWLNPSLGTYLPTGANGTSRSARMNQIGVQAVNYSDLDWYIDMSTCPTANKSLRFYYYNPGGSDSLRVLLSTDSGATFTLQNSYKIAAAWTQYSISLGAIASSKCIIRFRANPDNTSNISTSPLIENMGLDEIEVVPTSGAIPTITISPNNNIAICAAGQGQQSVTLTASGAVNYVWSPSLGLSSANTAIVTASPSISTVYTVTGTNAACQINTTTVLVTKNDNYELNVSANFPNVCNNGNSTIKANDTIYATNSIAPTGYCLTNLHSGSLFTPCIDYIQFGSLNTTPAVCGAPSFKDNSATIATTVYAGTSIPFTASLNILGTTNGSISVWIDYNQNGLFENTEYTSITNSLVGVTPITVNINIPSSAAAGLTRMRVRTRSFVNSNGATDACTAFVTGGGETEDYTIRIIKPISNLAYTWSPTTFIGAGNISNTVFANNITSSVIYTATATDAGGCSISQSVSINLLPLNAGTITPLSNNVCANSSTVLKANPFGGGQPYSYNWIGPNANNTANVIISTSDSASISPNATTTYTLNISDACGNSTSITKTVNIISTSPINITNATGGAMQICAMTTNNISLLATGAVTYTWLPVISSPSTINMSGSEVTAFLTNTTNYTVTGIDVNNCPVTATALISYRKDYPLTVTASPQYVCPGGTVTVNANDTIVGSLSAPTNYCNTQTHINTLSSCLDSFKLNTFTTWATTPCGAATYFNNSATNITPLVIGNLYTASATLNVSGFVNIWIDYNKDGIFDILEATTIVNNNNAGNFSFVIPNGTLPGATRLRIRTSSLPIGANDACSSLQDGTTHDYTVQLIQVSPSPITSFVWTTPPSAVPNLISTSGATVVSNPINSTTNFVVTATDVNGCAKQSATQGIIQPLVCSPITSTNGTTICDGNTTILQANAMGGGSPYIYSWADASGVIGTTQNITVSPSATQTYTVTITSQCLGSATCTSTITINVNTSPSLSTTTNPSSAIICGAGSVTLTANGAATYSWSALSSPTNLSLLTGASTVATPTISNTYIVTGVNANGCSKTSAINVVYSPQVNLNPTANPTGIGGCGGTVTITASDTAYGIGLLAPTTYCPNSATNATESDITNVQFGTMINSSTCGIVAPGPGSVGSQYSNFMTSITPPIIYSDSNVSYAVSVTDCSGVTFGAGVKIYVDYNRNGSFTDAGEEVYAMPIAVVGNFIISGNTNVPANAAAGPTRMRVIVSNTTTPNNIQPCSGVTRGEVEDYIIQIIKVPSSPFALTWVPGGLTGSPITVSPNVTTTYTVNGVNAQGCTTSSTVIVSVGSVSCNPITATPAAICLGKSSLLKANPALGTPPYSYAWSNGAITDTITVSPLVSSSYTCTITDACNATCTSSVTINVNALPSVSILQSATSICIIGSNTLTASTNANSPTYVWNPVTLLSSSSTSGTIFSVTTTPPISNVNVYTLTVTDGVTGCTNTATTSILFSNSFNVSTKAMPNAVCPNGVAILSANDTIISNATSPINYCTATHSTTSPCIIEVAFNGYVNNTGNACPNPGYSPPSATPVATLYSGALIPFTVITSPNGSTSPLTISVWVDYNRDGIYATTEWQQVSVNSLGNVPNTINLQVPNNVSPGLTNMRVRVRTAGGNTGGNACGSFGSGETEDYLVNLVSVSSSIPITNYSWATGVTSLGNGVSITTPSNSSTTTYSVTATNAYGCTTTTSITVNVQPLIADSIKGKSSFCSGSSDTLKVFSRFGGKPYTYLWAPAASIIFQQDSQAVIKPLVTTVYTVTIIDLCGTTSQLTYTANVINAPSVVVTSNVAGVCATGNASLTASGANTYVWNPATYLNTNNAANVTAINPTSSVTYTVTGTAVNGCIGSSSFFLNFSEALQVNTNIAATTLCNGQSVSLQVLDTVEAQNANLPSACTSAASNSSNEDIVNFTLGAGTNVINNTSTCNTLASGVGSILGRYSNFTSVIAVPNFYSNQTINFSALINSCNASNTSSAIKIFLDLNGNGAFTDPGELLFTSANSTSGSHLETGSFTLPNVLIPGNKRLRIINVQTNNPNSISSCASYSEGETEDYMINVVNVPIFTNTTFSWAPVTLPTTGKQVTATPTATTVYTVTIANNFGCTATSTITLNVGSLNVNIIRDLSGVLCTGTVDTLTAIVSGGGAPYTYTWSTGSSFNKVGDTINSTTTYSVTVADACSNTVSSSTTINVQTPPSITLLPTPASSSICGNDSVIIKASCNTCVNFNWSPNTSALDSVKVSPFVTTTYTLSSTDGLGCSTTQTITVQKSYTHSLVATGSAGVLCPTSTATLAVNDVTIGSGSTITPNTYCTPAHTAPSPCISNVVFGQLNNSTGTCSAPSYSLFNNSIPTFLAGTSATLFVTTTNNSGSNAANIAVWIDYNRDGSFSNAEYTLVANNALNNAQSSALINIPANALAGYTRMRVRTRVAGTTIGVLEECNLFATGETEDYVVSILNQVNGNNANTVYTWEPSTSFTNNTGNTISTLPVNTTTIFTVTATENGNCSYTQTVSINVSPLIVVDTNLYHLDCYGSSTGAIKVLPSGGNGAYTISIIPNIGIKNLSGDSIYNLPSGNYQISVIDGNSCSTSLAVTVTENSEIVANIFPTSSSCNGLPSGNAYAIVIGGFGNYSYNWLDDQFNNLPNIVSSNGDTVFNLIGGNYYLQIVDGKFCNTLNLFEAFSIGQPSNPLVFNSVVLTQPLCAQNTTGAVNASATGGTSLGTYNYALDNGTLQTNGIFNSVSLGSHTITVIDNNNCTRDSVISINAPSALTLTATPTDALCAGGLGSIATNITGGTPTYSVTINGNTPATSYASNATYSIVVTDANTCSTNTTVSVNAPSALTLTATPTDALCAGGLGSIATNITGGTPTYSVTINGNTPATSYASNATYSIVVTDANTCSTNTTVSVNSPSALTLTATPTDALCAGGLGSITTNITGGTPTYSVTINGNTPATSYASNATYSIVVTDANTCSTNTTVTINAPSALTLTATPTDALCAGGLGSIATNITGGTPTYSVTINGNTSATSYASNATYSIVVTDANTCSTNTTVSINAPSALTLTATPTDALCAGGLGSIATNITGGTPTYSVTINGNTPATSYASNATYSIVVTDANTCSTNTTVSVNSPSALTLTATPTDALCAGGLGSITTNITGGTPTYSVTINGNTPATSYASNATYSIVVTDANTCSTNTTVTINAPSALTLTATPTDALCAGGLGSIATNITGGTPTYSVTINGNTPATSYASNATYSIVVTDANTCSTNTTVTISAPSVLTLTATPTDALCAGGLGSIATNITGGTPTYSVTINGNTPATSYASNATYSIVVTDANTCSTNTAVSIGVINNLSITANVSATQLCIGNEVTLNAIPSSAVLQLSWQGGSAPLTNNTPFIENINGSVSYTVTASDNICIVNTTVSILLSNGNNILALANTNNILSLPGTSCDTANQVDAGIINYTSSTCNLIASVADVTDGISLGNVITCVEVLNNVTMFNTQPFVPRIYSLAAQNTSTVDLKLFFTNDDLDRYNNFILANSSPFPTLLNGSTASMPNGTAIPIAVTIVSNGPIGVGTIDTAIQTSAIWNAITQIWEVALRTLSNKMYYLHPINESNTPMGLVNVNFMGNKLDAHNLLSWTVNTERKIIDFEIHYSEDNIKYQLLENIISDNTKNTNNFLHKNVYSNNYFYELHSKFDNGEIEISNPVFINRSSTSIIYKVYPNPILDKLHIDIFSLTNQNVNIEIIDNVGKILKIINQTLEKGQNNVKLVLTDLVSGSYILRIKTKNTMLIQEKIIKL